MLFYPILFLALILSAGYLLLMLRYTRDWKKMPETAISEAEPGVSVSVIIVARNEEIDIAGCLKFIAAQQYPANLYEILLVDDHSEDKTVFIAEMLNIANLRILQPPAISGKKKLIEYAISQAKAELIVCTDADCFAPKDWIRSIAAIYTARNAKFIAAPVYFLTEDSLFNKFQALDFMGMMAITAAGISGKYLYMCNGANLAYPKSVFYEVGGYEGIDKKASGDDMLLMQKIAQKYPDDIVFIKNQKAAVATFPSQTLKGFWQQRIRWASKSGTYLQHSVQYQLLLVWSFMFSILVTAVFSVFDFRLLFLLCFQFLIKGIADYALLRSATVFFYKKYLLRVFIPSVFMHWAYILIVGFWSNVVKKYRWKGRIQS